MSLPGTPESLVRLLQRKVGTPSPGQPLHAWAITTICASEMNENLNNKVTIFPYRVDVDTTRRYDELPPAAPGEPSRMALALDVRVLLTVWGQTASGELQALARCMEIIDENPVLTGDDLDPIYDWLPGTAIRVSLDSLSTENLLQLWDALSPSFRLSVPYRLRTVRLSPRPTTDTPPVDTIVRHHGQARGGA